MTMNICARDPFRDGNCHVWDCLAADDNNSLVGVNDAMVVKQTKRENSKRVIKEKPKEETTTPIDELRECEMEIVPQDDCRNDDSNEHSSENDSKQGKKKWWRIKRPKRTNGDNNETFQKTKRSDKKKSDTDGGLKSKFACTKAKEERDEPEQRNSLSRLALKNANIKGIPSKDSGISDVLERERKQMRVVYDRFGNNAMEVLRMVEENGIPEPLQDDHVVVKVKVRTTL
jgi:hypothetical protein